MKEKNKVLEEWCFGGTKKQSDKLFDLVLSGKKTATCYFWEGEEPIKNKNAISVLTNFDKSKKIKIKTINQYMCKFCEVTLEHAIKEGEGDLTLEYWQEVHKKFFTKELQELGKTFSDDILLVCEEFTILKN